MNISFKDSCYLILILTLQYLLLRNAAFYTNRLWETLKSIKNGEYLLIPISLISFGLFAWIPSQIPAWIFWIILGSLVVFSSLRRRWIRGPFYKFISLLLFGAMLNGSLIFWMHEEANAGRHLRYAQQLAEKQDTIAENILLEFSELEKSIPEGTNVYDFWEKQWLGNPYLSSNYYFNLISNIPDSNAILYQPILFLDDESAPIYNINFPEKYTLAFKLNADFRRSIYSSNQDFKNLKNLQHFQFAVVNQSKIILSNTHAFDSHIFDVELPEVGKGEKVNVQGFDVLAYHHSDDVYVLIGEPLSEFQVWMSNFGFLFTLLLGVAILMEILRLLIKGKKLIPYWQELPIQSRIQIILIAITCALFFIIAMTTFVFLHQNNFDISYERQLYTSETLKDEILKELEQRGWQLDDFDKYLLLDLANSKHCDIDFYNPQRQLMLSSFASSQNSPSPNTIDDEILNRIKKNPSLTIVQRQNTVYENESYLRSYFGVFDNIGFQGIVTISSFESDIGTAPYIPIVMVKLLNVYVFLLLITWGAGLLLINLLTRPLELLASRLSNFKLGKQNKKLDWKGDDAIGQLISEYNTMVDQVEETTQILMRNEREEAWQIMAQQIAHEINNKLTPLKLIVQFLEQRVNHLDSNESESIKQITRGLLGKIENLSKVAAQFKLFAKLETPKIELIELNPFLEQFLFHHQRKEGFQYLFDSSENNTQLAIHMDIHHFNEVFNNIISNAENSITDEREGIISLRLKEDDNNAIIEIEDNGKGIDLDVIQNIFDPKFSVNSSQTGLGLPICKKIVDFYNGEIHFKTMDPTGTCVVISFPKAKVW